MPHRGRGAGASRHARSELRYDGNAMQLCASTLLLAQGLASTLREVNACGPNRLHEHIVDASERCKSPVGPKGPEPVLAGERQNPQSAGWQVAISAFWRLCLEYMTAVEAAIVSFDRASTVPERAAPQGMSAEPTRR